MRSLEVAVSALRIVKDNELESALDTRMTQGARCCMILDPHLLTNPDQGRSSMIRGSSRAIANSQQAPITMLICRMCEGRDYSASRTTVGFSKLGSSTAILNRRTTRVGCFRSQRTAPRALWERGCHS